MFFSPTLTSLLAPDLGNHVKILCLSNGNAEGLGEKRKSELETSGLILGLRAATDIYVHNSPKFKDGMTEDWKAEDIAALLKTAFASPNVKKNPTTAAEAPIATIDVLITFDGKGVSSHPNHISLYNGARQFLRTLLHGKHGYASPVDLYTLTTVGLVRKYVGILDVGWSLLEMAFGRNASAWRKKSKTKTRGTEPRLLFVSDLEGITKGWRAMVQAHASQMKWFRWGWIGVSRYMYVNDLKLVKI